MIAAASRHAFSGEFDLNVVNINFPVTIAAAILVEFNIVVNTFVAVCVGFVDFGAFWQFTVCLQRSGFVGAVFQDHVTLLVLIVT